MVEFGGFLSDFLQGNLFFGLIHNLSLFEHSNVVNHFFNFMRFRVNFWILLILSGYRVERLFFELLIFLPLKILQNLQKCLDFP